MRLVGLTTIWGWTLLLLAARTVQGGSIEDSFKDKFSKTATKHDAIVDLSTVMDRVAINPILETLTGASKANKVVSILKELTSAAQADLMKAINSFGISATPLWISNDIFLKDASLSVLQSLANIPGEFIIREPVTVHISPVSSPVPADQYSSGESRAGEEVQWGVSKIGAPAVWASKTKGEGIIIANVDTGVNWKHEALKDNYAGQWLDLASNPPSEHPIDDNGHGTHTTGSACGTTRGIGVAPGAQWIACKALNAEGSGAELALKQCFQWIMEDKKADVVSNSWGTGGGSTYFNKVISACEKAGIYSVFAIGNRGPNCTTTMSPGDQFVAFSVGSTTDADKISSYSSRGPSLKTHLIKPDVSAPGQHILSSYHNSTDSYVYLSGTSMATPHVAGAIALMRSAKPTLTYLQIKGKLEHTALRPTILQKEVCVHPKGTASLYPNNAYGHGRIRVNAALGL